MLTRLLVAALAVTGAVEFHARADAATSQAAPSEPFLIGPPTAVGPAIVRAGFRLLDVNAIDDEAETFEFSGVLTFTWRDKRQAFDSAALGVDERVYQGAFQFNEVFDGWFPQIVLVNTTGSYATQGVVLRVRPDGSMTLVQTVNAACEADLELRRYPFDRQRLEAVFEVLGFDDREIALQTGSKNATVESGISIPQWDVIGVSGTIRDRAAPYAGTRGVASAYVVKIDVRRKPLFMARLVILPLIIIVMLSWSVFWMDRSSLGDRISVSFIGILTAVAYQIVVGGIMPHISYVTFMNAFLNVSLLIMCATVVINLVVGTLDKRGRVKAGDIIDLRCRWLFPIAYFGLVLLSAVITLLF